MSPLDAERRWFEGGRRGVDICDAGGIAGVCNHLTTRWIDPVPSAERGTQAAHWWRWLVHKHDTDCDLVAADADISIQLAQLTVVKENETLRLVCMGRRREREKTKRRNQFSHLLSWHLMYKYIYIYIYIYTGEQDRRIYTSDSDPQTHARTEALSGAYMSPLNRSFISCPPFLPHAY